MNQVHELKILNEYFEGVNEGVKTFEIRKNDRNFQVGDFLQLKEFTGEQFTGREILQQVTFMTDYEQKEGYVVMSIQSVPISFGLYLNMSEKEKVIFKKVITHIHLYGTGDRDVTNTLWEIIDELVERRGLTESDLQWYREFWHED
ncbi:DUF3850 domain-containing protein [Lysinibacillus sphaericus]|uniref:DUF3850 domain-containing protein n=1 Tax=Lysinibacillus sphaericus TaxID=1421 RepID=UPI003F7A593D